MEAGNVIVSAEAETVMVAVGAQAIKVGPLRVKVGKAVQLGSEQEATVVTVDTPFVAIVEVATQEHALEYLAAPQVVATNVGTALFTLNVYVEQNAAAGVGVRINALRRLSFAHAAEAH